ncbi:MAG: ATP-binding protein [Cytophagales bacterium]|nr:ATP-binding protein [Bernardetiaceae bacterium]MDW8211474.1 ATP-binding protein [Cytophagales bacterium]
MKQSQQWEHSINLSCKRDSLSHLRQFARNALSKWAIPEEQQYLLILALDEVCANLIIHAHCCNDAHAIEVKIIRLPNEINFEVQDSKPDHFNMALYQVPDVRQIILEKKRNGLGLFLVKQIMDEITVEQRGSIKICRMKKKLSLPEASS